MNVIFHTITGLALGSVLSSNRKVKNLKNHKFKKTKDIVIGFTLGVISHGLLDILPHRYHFKSHIDIILSLVIFIIAILIIEKELKLLFLICFLGSIFPDLVDLGPELANQYFNLNLPVIENKIFLWHLPEYSGSIYKNISPVSNLAHILVLSLDVILISINIKFKLKFFKED